MVLLSFPIILSSLEKEAWMRRAFFLNRMRFHKFCSRKSENEQFNRTAPHQATDYCSFQNEKVSTAWAINRNQCFERAPVILYAIKCAFGGLVEDRKSYKCSSFEECEVQHLIAQLKELLWYIKEQTLCIILCAFEVKQWRKKKPRFCCIDRSRCIGSFMNIVPNARHFSFNHSLACSEQVLLRVPRSLCRLLGHARQWTIHNAWNWYSCVAPARAEPLQDSDGSRCVHTPDIASWIFDEWGVGRFWEMGRLGLCQWYFDLGMDSI